MDRSVSLKLKLLFQKKAEVITKLRALEKTPARTTWSKENLNAHRQAMNELMDLEQEIQLVFGSKKR